MYIASYKVTCGLFVYDLPAQGSFSHLCVLRAEVITSPIICLLIMVARGRTPQNLALLVFIL